MMRELFELTPEHLMRCQCLEAMVGIYAELDKWEVGVSNMRLGALARKHLALYNALRQLQRDDDLWALIPKHHLLIHVCESATSNPKLSWNYRDESEIGDAADMAAGCNQSTVSTCMLERYRVTFELET